MPRCTAVSAKNPEAWLAYREQVNAYVREYRRKNRARIRLKRREDYQRTKTRDLALAKRWEKDNRERVRELKRINEAKRSAAKAGSPGTHSWEEWVFLVRTSGNKCLRCWCAGNEHTLHQDHIVPLASRGSNSIDNIQPLCGSCNVSKHCRAVDYRFDRFSPMLGGVTTPRDLYSQVGDSKPNRRSIHAPNH